MEVKIRKIGWNKGTCGWLAAGLENGTLELVEGKLKNNGNHALWLKGDGVTQFLAAFNMFDEPKYCGNHDKYEPADHLDYRGSCFTDACWATLMSIARKWCDILNEERDNDKEIEVSIIRVSSGESVNKDLHRQLVLPFDEEDK